MARAILVVSVVNLMCKHDILSFKTHFCTMSIFSFLLVVPFLHHTTIVVSCSKFNKCLRGFSFQRPCILSSESLQLESFRTGNLSRDAPANLSLHSIHRRLALKIFFFINRLFSEL